jgi:serine protease
MTKRALLLLTVLMAITLVCSAAPLKPRLTFEKYLWADGVDPKARFLNELMVKFFDEDLIRLREGGLISLNGSTSLAYTKDFLARHPEIKPEVIITTETEEQHLARLSRIEQQCGKDLVDMFSFYRFRLPEAPADAKALLADILKAPEVETAYYEPIPIDLTCTDIGVTTPNLVPYQGFKNAAPQGVDLVYANTTFGVEVCDGETTTDIGIFERGLQTTHEDFTTATVRTAGAPDTDNDHGTAVSGIIGACDENGVGVTGFVADEGVRLYQRNSASYASVADIYNLANSQLAAGEITNSSWGYTASPLPPGQSCSCNPSQNGSVPCEYNAGVKAEIDAGTAAGIHYFIAAANGCVNLDWSGFGSTFDFTTGAVYCGAGISTGDHDAECFTDYGSRITSYAWGDGVTTLGYDNHAQFPGVHTKNEWYTDSFNGTSSATPIVCGVAGVLNNLYRSINAGANISATTMRSWLQVGGTPAGNVTPGNIGVMPNLFAITSPNLNPDIRSGWSGYVVPRNSSDASGASCTLPTTLVSDPDTTFWNADIENTSNFGTATPAAYNLYRDDVLILLASHSSLGPLATTYFVNAAYPGSGTNVRGGRHTTRVTCDPNDVVSEYYESDNSWTGQYVWNPRLLTAESPLQFSHPPTKFVTDQPGSYENCDGYQLYSGFSGWWDLMGVISSSASADYDARFYSEAITSTNGFDTYEALSSYSGLVDIVGRNQHNVSATPLASVVNYDGASDDYVVEGETSGSAGTPGVGRISAGSFSMTANEIMEAVEFNVDALVSYEIEADVTAGNANLVISVFGPDDSYFGLPNRNASANANGAGESEHLCFTPTQTGPHLALFHKYNALDWGQTSTFTAYIGKSEFDLTHNLNAGWSHQIVVRQTSGALPAVLPAALTGNVGTNYLNAGLMNVGCVTSPLNLNNAFYLDGPLVFTTAGLVTHAPGVEGWVSNQGPVFVFGGRHNIGEVIDVNNEGAEWNESNNRHDEQFVWTPYAMTNLTAYLTSNPAPNFRNTESSVLFSPWNQDGWRFTGSNHWSGVAYCPTNAGDYYVAGLYSPSTGSTNGFGSYLVPSFGSGTGGLGFLVENGNSNGAVSFDMGVTNNYSYPGTPSLAGYRTSQCNSLQDLINGASNGPFTLGLNQLIHVFDLQLTAGISTRFILDNLGGVDLGLAIFDPNDLYGSRSNSGTIVNAAGDGADETVNFVPTVTGRHGIVVFKNNSTDLGSCQYRMIIGDRTAAAPQRLVLQVIDNTVDPIHMRAHWDSVTVDNHGVPLNVDSYQLYYTFDSVISTFPAGWSPLASTPLATFDFFVSPVVRYFRVVVTARDNDGFLIAHTPLPDGVDLDPGAVRFDPSVNPPGQMALPVGAPVIR